MQGPLAIVVLWCLETAPLDSFDPHRVNAARQFVADNPATCHADPPEYVRGPRSVEQCRGWAMLHWMPRWLSRSSSAGKVFLTVECHEDVVSDPLDMEAVKRRMRN